MADSSKNTVITVAGRKKICQARAGAITLPTIEGMAFGSGGVDSSGTVIAPSETQTALTERKLTATHCLRRQRQDTPVL